MRSPTITKLNKQVLEIDLPFIDGIKPAKQPERVPVVFTRSEVKSILANLDGVHHLMASLLYGSGLRLTECLNLRVKDIDFEYQQIIVRDMPTKNGHGNLFFLPIIVQKTRVRV